MKKRSGLIGNLLYKIESLHIKITYKIHQNSVAWLQIHKTINKITDK